MIPIANVLIDNKTEYADAPIAVATLVAFRQARILRWGRRAEVRQVSVVDARSEYPTGMALISGGQCVVRLPKQNILGNSRVSARDSRYSRTVLNFTRRGWVEAYLGIIGHEAMHMAGFDGTPKGEWLCEMASSALLNHWREHLELYSRLVLRTEKLFCREQWNEAGEMLRKSLVF